MILEELLDLLATMPKTARVEVRTRYYDDEPDPYDCDTATVASVHYDKGEIIIQLDKE